MAHQDVRPQTLIGLTTLTAALLCATDLRAEDTGPQESYIYFIAPTADAYFPESSVTIDVQVGVFQGVTLVEEVSLIVDQADAGMQSCAEGCTFTGVMLGQGEHTLRITAASNTLIAEIAVYVGEEPPADTNDDMQGGADEAEAGNDDTGPAEKGCTVVDGSPWGLLALPALLLVPALRRRRDED